MLADSVTPGMTVAVGAGSRGLTDRVGLLRGTIDGLRRLGAEPFVVPAMGSHGGATAEGQREVLASYGITEETMGVPIHASMASATPRAGVVPGWRDELPHRCLDTGARNRHAPAVFLIA